MMSTSDQLMEVSVPESQAPPPPPEDQITEKEAARQFGIKPNTIAGWRRRGWISFWRRGGPRGFVVMSRREIAARVAEWRALRPGRVLPSYEPDETTTTDESS